MLCSEKTAVTGAQERARIYLETSIRKIVMNLPATPDFKTLKRNFGGGHVGIDTRTNQAFFDPDAGCLTIGVPETRADLRVLLARGLLALVKGVMRGRPCTSAYLEILQRAKRLGFAVRLECADTRKYALRASGLGPSESQCAKQRYVFPEYVGHYVKKVVADLRKRYPRARIQQVTYDAMNGVPVTDADVIIVTFDAPTGLVTRPMPHFGIIPSPTTDDTCFMKPDAGLKCVGAPVRPAPDFFKRGIGKYIQDTYDSLRIRYPHAVVDMIPNNLGVPPDIRTDRIRVRFDPLGIVTSIDLE